MKKKGFPVVYSLLVLSLIGCFIDVAQPVVSASPTLPGEIGPGSTTPSAGTTTIPVTWSGLNLTGSLVYISPPVADDVSFFISRRKLNLITGEITPIFTTTSDDWIYYASVSRDAKQLIMSYVPTTQSSASSSQALYRIPLDETAPPQLLFSPPTPDDHYVHAEWSPDGKYITMLTIIVIIGFQGCLNLFTIFSE